MPIFDQKDGQTKLIVFGARQSKVRAIDTHTWHKISEDQFQKVPQNIINDLLDAEILVTEDEDELKTILVQNHDEATAYSMLRYMILPTAMCQLGCSSDYCGQYHTHHMMSEKDQALLIARIESKLKVHHYKSLNIGWYGGEPTLGIKAIRQLNYRLIKLAEKYHVEYSSYMITNGVSLGRKMAEELVTKHYVKSVQVTLDGSAEYHDTRRCTKKGKPTFKKIFQNVVDLAQREDLGEVKIIIRCNVDYRNRDGILPLLHLIKKMGIHQRVDMSIAHVQSWGHDEDKYSPPPDEFAVWEIEWFLKMKEMGFKLPPLLPARRKVICIANQSDSELVDAYGNLFNCIEVSYVPTYEVASKTGKTSYVPISLVRKMDKTISQTPVPLTNVFTLGHLSTGETTGNRSILGSFSQKVQKGQYLCTNCSMLPVCGGACPKHWFDGNPPCPSTKYNLEERLLLAYAEKRMNKSSAT